MRLGTRSENQSASFLLLFNNDLCSFIHTFFQVHNLNASLARFHDVYNAPVGALSQRAPAGISLHADVFDTSLWSHAACLLHGSYVSEYLKFSFTNLKLPEKL